MRASLQSEWLVIALLFALALATRLPFIAHPAVSMFDEGLYARFTQLADQGTPFFDIHPPMARLTMLEVYRASAHDDSPFPIAPRTPWGAFPYVPLRILSTLSGALLCVIVFLVGRRIGYPPYFAAIPALFVVFDNALVLYSRAILPDMLLLLAAFSSLFFALYGASHGGRRRVVSVVLSGVFLGAAIATKWTALGMLLVVLFVFLRERKGMRDIFIVLASAFLFYLFAFIGYQSLFQGGRVATVQPRYAGTWIDEVRFPEGSDASAVLTYFPVSEKERFIAGSDRMINENVFHSVPPLRWMLGDANFLFWFREDKAATIRFVGNLATWALGILSLVTLLSFAAMRVASARRWPLDSREHLLMLGFFANYLPFFFIERPMYLYHYFVSLLFLFLLVPSTISRIERIATERGVSPALLNRVVMLLVIVSIVSFTLIAPMTYGCSVSGGIVCSE